MKLALDSGAHSLYNKYVKGSRDFSFYESDEFWEFADDYANFLLENKDRFEFYVCMDVIRNPELS